MKSLKPKQVIDLLSEKVSLKRQLRTAKKERDEQLISSLTAKLSKIETKISSHTLVKN
jgi:hypothetical protein